MKISLPNPPSKVTRREKEILACLAEGLSSKQIAGKLNISKYTVDNHRINLLRKFNVKNSVELVLVINVFLK